MVYRVSFKWLKRFMPRSLYGRAALILILPVITLQLGISVVFIQRHFERVTEQMTGTVVLQLRYILEEIDAAPDLASAQDTAVSIARPLQLNVTLPASAVPQEDVLRWFDVPGRVIEETLRARIDGVGPVVMRTNRRVEVWLETRFGPIAVDFSRSRVSASNPHQLLVWMVVIGALMTLIAYFYLRNQLRPIKRLANASAEYGRGRIVPYHPSGANEVRAAGHAFLDMRGRIERQTQTRTMMLSGVSHDLRTPLTRLRLGLGLLDDDEVEPLIRDVDDMQHLLDAFLDFARGDAEDAPEPTDPVALLHQVVADAHRMRQNVHLGDVSGDGNVHLRPLAVRRALENLIGNGLRYGSEVIVGVIVTPRAVRFTVEDDGPGIPEDQRDDAMRPFTRLDPARNQNRGSGVGLGLAIVEDIARSQGGSLRLGESEALGGLKAEIVLGR